MIAGGSCQHSGGPLEHQKILSKGWSQIRVLDFLKQLYSMITLSEGKSKDTTEELWIFSYQN